MEEKKEKRVKTEIKKEKNCKLGVFGRTSDFNNIIGGLDFNILYVVLRPGILFFKFNHWNSFVQIQVRISRKNCIFTLLPISVF